MAEPIILKKNNLLSFVKNYIPENAIIVEAGAFNGNDTKQLHFQWPAASIHAFEPVPDIFSILETNTGSIPSIRRYNSALSDTVGFAPFYISENPKKPGNPFPAGSLRAPQERLRWSNIQYNKTINVPTTTLDAWATQQSITHIDFLWLDLQGHTLTVLQASPNILSRTHIIYTEVEFVKAYTDQACYPEVRSWLEAHNFTMVARDFTDETSWFFGNILFVHNNYPIPTKHQY